MSVDLGAVQAAAGNAAAANGAGPVRGTLLAEIDVEGRRTGRWSVARGATSYTPVGLADLIEMRTADGLKRISATGLRNYLGAAGATVTLIRDGRIAPIVAASEGRPAETPWDDADQT